MPDYVAEKDDHIAVYADELCMSCLVKDECEFIHTLIAQQVVASDSIHIISCGKYVPDKESEYYVDTSDIDEFLRDIDEMKKEFIGLMRDLDDIIGKRHNEHN